MNSIVIPSIWFRRLMLRMLRANDWTAVCRVGTRQSSDGITLLIRDFDLLSSAPKSTPQAADPVLIVSMSDPQPREASHVPLPANVAGHLWIGTGDFRGKIWGVAERDFGAEPIHLLRLPGPGMHQVSLEPHGPKSHLGPGQESSGLRFSPPNRLDGRQIPERWSRSIGGLGGFEVWRRLKRLSFAIVGCGRSGSLMAANMVRWGVKQIVLIDEDVLEEHSLGEMDLVTASDVGTPKAEALARELKRISSPNVNIAAVCAALTEPRSLAATKSCEVMVLCVDRDSARLAAAIVATQNHQVLLDLGAGIQFPQGYFQGNALNAGPPPRTMGADIRLIVPGDGCLLCRGNLSRYRQAMERLCNGNEDSSGKADWTRERAGSLRSLNQCMVGVAVRMLEDFVAERITHSDWARLEFDNHGRLAIHFPSVQLNQTVCPLCEKAGMGDSGLFTQQDDGAGSNEVPVSQRRDQR